ncbi:hypothetical protein JHK87_045029 [Glycine soja]|nr:hypothetical protein JHK87_045029 [Glycine soja]
MLSGPNLVVERGSLIVASSCLCFWSQTEDLLCEVSERASELPQPLTHSTVAVLRAPGPEPLTYLDDFPHPDPNHDETILVIPRAASGKNISAKERRAGQLRSIVFEQEDGQHGGKKCLIYPPSFVAKLVAREDDVRECATTVHAANSYVPSGIRFSRPVFHHDGSWPVAYFTDAFDLASSKGGGGSGNISALLSSVPRDVNMQLLHVGDVKQKVNFVHKAPKKILNAPSLPLSKRSTPRLPEFQEFHLKTQERAMQHTSATSTSSLHCNDSDKIYMISDLRGTEVCWLQDLDKHRAISVQENRIRDLRRQRAGPFYDFVGTRLTSVKIKGLNSGTIDLSSYVWTYKVLVEQ